MVETGLAGGVRGRHSRDRSQSSFDQTTEWLELHHDRGVFSIGKKNISLPVFLVSAIFPDTLNSYQSVPQEDQPTCRLWLEMGLVVHLHYILTLPRKKGN